MHSSKSSKTVKLSRTEFQNFKKSLTILFQANNENSNNLENYMKFDKLFLITKSDNDHW